MHWIRHPKDFWAGALFIAFGTAAITIGASYPVGTAARMGPGYFPRVLGLMLVVLGLILALRALKLKGTPLAMRNVKPLLIVLGQRPGVRPHRDAARHRRRDGAADPDLEHRRAASSAGRRR